MQGTSTQSSFYIRTINPTRPNTYQPNKPFISIQPQKIEILNYTKGVIVSKTITVKNDAKLPKKIEVVAPMKSYFSIRCPEKEIRGKDSIQIYVLFNPQKERSVIQDELVVKLRGEQTEFHVPIYCYPQNILSRPQSRKIISKRESQFKNETALRRQSMRSRKMQKRSSIVLVGSLLIENTFGNEVYSVHKANFEQKYRMISDYVREKSVKNEVYLGAKPIAQQKQQEIQEFKVLIIKSEAERLQKEVTNRFVVSYANQGPVVSNEVQINLTWNTQRNIPSMNFKMGVKKLQEEVRKHVMMLRFEKIRNSLKIFDEYKKKTNNLERKIKIEEFVEYLQNRLAEKFVASEYQFEFDNISIQPTMLPVDSQYRTIQNTFQISQRVEFDSWVPMNILKPSFQEIYSQEETDFPPFFYHHPTVISDNKKGGIQEMPFKQSDQFEVSQIQHLLEVNLEETVTNTQFLRDIIQNKEKMFLTTDIVQQEDQLPEQQLMDLGPLNRFRWNRRPTTSVDMYSSIRQ